MKRLFRIFIFSFFALFITSYWNKGFILPMNTMEFIKAGGALTILFVIVRPLMKVVFLPLNLLTFGLFTFGLYIFSLHLLSSYFGFFIIKTWSWNGYFLGYLQNLVLSSFSLSSIINVLDKLT